MDENTFNDVRPVADEVVLAALKDNSTEQLQSVVIGVSLYHSDLSFATRLCMKLASHADEFVRGNSILGLGHIARRFESLDEITIKPIIEQGLCDNSEYVRGQAWAAADDANHFHHWIIKGFRPG